MMESFRHNKRLIIHYYIVITIITILFYWFTRNEHSIDLIITSILAVYVLLFPIVLLYTRKYAVHIFLFLLALITGFYSFYQYSIEPHSVLNALYFTFQLFLLVVNDVFTEDGSSLLQYPLIVEIARWSAASYTISTVFIAMFRLLESSILLVYYQIIGNHYVIFGYNENSASFIEDFRKKKKRVILVAHHLTNETIDYLNNMKVVVLSSRETTENIYSKSRINRAKAVVLLHEKDIDNLNEFMGIQHYFKNHHLRIANLTIYLHLQDMTSKKLYSDLRNTDDHKQLTFRVIPINLYELFVNTLFEKHRIDTINKNEQPNHFLVVGFGLLGQHIALKATENKELTDPFIPKVTAIDKNMSKIKQNWDRQHQHHAHFQNITLSTFDIEVEKLESIINEQTVPITHVFICLHEDKLDLLTGIELSHQLPDIPIYLEFSEGSVTDKWIQSESSGNRLIYGTGTFKEILTEEKLLQ